MYEEIKKSIPDELRHLAKTVQGAGYKFFIVGGFVRDIFLGSCDVYENDIDVCGDCTPDAFAELIKDDKKIKLCEANYPLGTLKLIVGKIDIEYTCFRTESYRGDGFHTPSKIVFTKDMFSDAERRDFTINALYLNPVTCEITDFFGGITHIENKVIKTVRDSVEVFTEDALRILRMCRFSAKLGFEIDAQTMNGAKDCSHLLNNISKERIGVELDKIIWDTEYADFGVNAIYDADINQFVCKNILRKTAMKIPISPRDRFIRWAVFLSDRIPHDAQKFIINLSLGKPLAKEVSRLIKDKDISNKEINEIILYFAKIGKQAAKRQVDYAKVFSYDKHKYLCDIYNAMIHKGQFINYNELAVTGNDIIDVLSVTGKQIKHYKDLAYEYAVLNPQKNNCVDLKAFLKSIYH